MARLLLGLALLLAAAGPLALAARRVRARAWPEAAGAPARLGEVVLVLAGLLLVAEVLGTVGLLRPGPVVLGCAVLAAGAGAVATRSTPVAETGAAPPGRPGRIPLLAAAGAGGLILFEWGARTLEATGRGMTDPDTLWYHMPFAARFAQEGWITRLHFAESEPITTFHPANSELLHGVFISLLGGSDALSPWVSLAFAALALLAGWCAGRSHGVGPASLTAVAVALASPILLTTQPGEAANDVVGLALLLSAAALLVEGGLDRPGPVALAALAAGLALGTKLSLLAPVGALTVAVLVVAARGGRVALGLAWVGPLVVCGGFWYGRNLARTGNPLPWIGVDLGPLELPSVAAPVTRSSSASVLSYLDDVDVVRGSLIPGLAESLGPVWAILLLAAALGLFAALAVPGPVRVLGAVGLISGLAYLVTPGGAGGPPGSPALFGLNLRFATPSLALGLVLLPLAPPLRAPARRVAVVAVLAVLLVLTQAGEGLWPLVGGGEALVLCGLVAAAAALGWLVGARRAAGRPLRLAAAGVLVLVLVLGGLGLATEQRYRRDRYATPGPTVAPVSVWAARGLRNARIAVAGYLLQYPLYGPDLSNRVEVIGRPGANGTFSPLPSCGAWRRALRAGRFTHVVTAPEGSIVLGPRRPGGGGSAEAGWTRGAPGVIEEGRSERDEAVFRVVGPVGESGCPRG